MGWRLSHEPGPLAPARAHAVSISLVFVLLCTAALVWPALYNGFPLVFSDTGTYISTLRERHVPIDRPVYYGAVVGAIARLFGLSSIPFVQALAMSYVALLFYRWLAPGASTTATVLAIVALALLTPVSWLCSWLMPDMLGGFVVLIPILLLLARRQLHWAHQAALSALLLFALLSHSGNVLLFGAFASGAVLACFLVQKNIDRTAIVLLTGTGAAAVFLAMLPNGLAHGRWTINPGSQAFVAARLAGDGILQKFLARHCPTEPALPLCDRQGELAGISTNAFLWNGKPKPPGEAAGAWNERARDFRELNGRAISENLVEFLTIGARNTAELLLRTELGNDPVDHNLRIYGPETTVTRKIARHFPAEWRDYAESRQQQGTLELHPINRIHGIWTWASYVLLAVAGVVAWRRGERLLLTVIGLIFFSLLLNAVVHGALSGVYTRYQVKVSWIPTFVAFACFAALRRPRAVGDRQQAGLVADG